MHVICLHEVRSPARSDFDIEWSELWEFINQLDRSGYTICPPSLAVRAPWSEEPSRLVALTFDDGYRNSCGHGLKLMRELGVPLGLAPISSLVGGTDSSYVDVDDLQAWLNAGGELIAHTHSHARLRDLRRDDIVAELDLDLEFYAAKSLVQPSMFAYPYGGFSRVARVEVARRYACAFATGDGRMGLPLDIYALRRTTFRREKLKDLLMLNWELFESERSLAN